MLSFLTFLRENPLVVVALAVVSLIVVLIAMAITDSNAREGVVVGHQPAGPELLIKSVTIKDSAGGFIILTVNKKNQIGEAQVGQSEYLKAGTYRDLKIKYFVTDGTVEDFINSGVTILVMLIVDANKNKMADNDDLIVDEKHPQITESPVDSSEIPNLPKEDILEIEDQALDGGLVVKKLAISNPNGGFILVVGKGTEQIATSPYLPAGTYENLGIEYFPPGSNYEELSVGDKLAIFLYVDSNLNFNFDQPDLPVTPKTFITLK